MSRKDVITDDCSVNLRLQLRKGNEPMFGTGICLLLRKTGVHESLKAAAEEMGMNYKKALYIVRRAEAFYGEALLLRSTGGVGGGGSRPTPFAMELMEQFEQLEAELLQRAETLSAQFPRLFPKESPLPDGSVKNAQRCVKNAQRQR